MYSSTEIREYVKSALRLANADYREVDGDLLAARVTVEHPPLFFGPPRLETVVLNLVFRPEAVANYPGAELVVPGSYRLDWFIDGMRRRGNLALQCVCYDTNLRRWQREIQSLLPPDFPYFFFHHPSLNYRPFLLANILISYRTDERSDELFSVGLDLIDGKIWPDLQDALQSHTLSSRLPSAGILKERITPAEAIAICKRRAEEKGRERNPAWIAESKKRFAIELDCLKRFYAGEGEQDEFKRRADEIYNKFRPRIVLSWVNLALVYLPEVTYTLQSLDGRELPKAVYYPVGTRLILEEPQPNGEKRR